jgi:SAM-dependent methyltransferase
MKVCLACSARFDSPQWRCPECGTSPTNGVYIGFAAADGEAHAFPEESFEYLPQLEETFWFRERSGLIDWALRKYFPRAKTVFELGCGTGVVLAALHARRPELTLAGGDPFPAGLAVARLRVPDVPLYQLDGRRLPFEEEFDVVGAFDVLEHVEDDNRMLAQMFQAAKPGGGILLSVPQHPWLWSPADDFARHRRRYTSRELIERVEHVGFRVVRKTSFVSLLLPTLALSRLRARSRNDYDPASEFALPQSVDRLFGAAMRLERRLIRSGLSFPVGSSLLIAAYRP